MKFEKFLKQTGTHGTVIERNESEKWLVCGGVGMVIPRGVDNLLGTPTNNENTSIIDALTVVECDESLTLEKAVLLDPTGNAKAIYRVFETDIGDKIGITNADYGLLEKSDLLGYCELETEDEKIVKYMVVYDYDGNALGFITGSHKF